MGRWFFLRVFLGLSYFGQSLIDLGFRVGVKGRDFLRVLLGLRLVEFCQNLIGVGFRDLGPSV